jgi:hypothetical protein
MMVVMIHMKMNLQNCILLKIVHLMNIHQIVVKKTAKSNLLVIHRMMNQKNFLLMNMKNLNYIHFENCLSKNMKKNLLVYLMSMKMRLHLFVVLLMNCVLLVQIVLQMKAHLLLVPDEKSALVHEKLLLHVKNLIYYCSFLCSVRRKVLA